MNQKTVQTVEEPTTELVVPKTNILKQKAFLVGTAVGVALTGLTVAVLAKATGRADIVIADPIEESSTD